MQKTDLLSHAAQLIMSTDTTQPGPYGLFVTNGQLHCKPLMLRCRDDIFLMRYTKTEAKSGFLSSEWDRIAGVLRRLHKEDKL